MIGAELMLHYPHLTGGFNCTSCVLVLNFLNKDQILYLKNKGK